MKKIGIYFILICVLCLGVALFVGCNKDANDIYAVTVQTPPDKVEYYAGESLDMKGCKLLVRTHSGNDYTVDVTNDMCSGFVSTLGKHDITISYAVDGKTFVTNQQYVIIQHTAKSVTVLKAPDKVDYVDGDEVNAEGIVLEVTFSDGLVAERTAGAVVCEKSRVSLGDESLRFRIDSIWFEIPITVSEKKIDGIRVTKSPAKTTYQEGESFDPTGMKVYLVYNNGELAQETSPIILDIDPLTSAQKYVRLSVLYEDKEFTANVPVTVSKRTVSSLVLDLSGATTSYQVNVPWSFRGITATVTFADEGTTTATADELIFKIGSAVVDPNASHAVGTYRVDVYYKYAAGSTAHDSFSVRVTKDPVLVSIRFKEGSQPEYTEYAVGDEIILRGVRIEAVYNDGSEPEDIVNGSVLADGVTVTPAIVAANTKEIVFSYGGKTCSFPITVLVEND